MVSINKQNQFLSCETQPIDEHTQKLMNEYGSLQAIVDELRAGNYVSEVGDPLVCNIAFAKLVQLAEIKNEQV